MPKLRGVRWAAWAMFLLFLGSTTITYADPTQRAIYSEGIYYYDVQAGSACGSTSSDTSSQTKAAASTDITSQKIASTFIIGLDASHPKTSQAIALDLATKYHIGGTFLTGTSDAAKAGFDKAFYDSLSKAAGSPVLATSDEEGVVTRYNYGFRFPTAKQMAGMTIPEVQGIGQKVGTAMNDNGLVADLAPVLDLRDVGGSWADGRSFSSKPSVVADKAGAFATGLQSSGIKPIFKHFPGFDSSTSGTTDDQKVVMKGSISKTVAPYKTLLPKFPNAGVMLSNMYVNALDTDNPSSLSTATVQYLRKTLNFNGFITTDDLNVSSVTKKAGSLGDAVATALQAGVTMPLFQLDGNTVSAAENNLDRIIGTVQTNTAAMSAIDSSASSRTAFTGASNTNAGGSASTNAASNSSGCCNSGTVALSGNSNKAKIFNYFIDKGLSAAAAAGIMGNMSAESSFDPTAEQNPGDWEDLTNEKDHAVGLVQWDLGRRPAVINYMKGKGLTDADFHKATDLLLGTELDYVWKELNTNYKDTLQTIQKDTDAGQAAFHFHQGYEGSADSEAAIKANRMDVAVKIFNEFSGKAASAGGAGANCAASPVCTSAAGAAKIICAAKAYDSASYVFGAAHGSAKDWHKNCPTIGPSCSMDCSGLVNLAVYDAFGVDLEEDTNSERSDTTHWQKVTSLGQVQPGDIMQPNSDHVEVVDHVSGSLIYTFGAHTDEFPQPQQVSPATYHYSADMLFLHFKGAN